MDSILLKDKSSQNFSLKTVPKVSGDFIFQLFATAPLLSSLTIKQCVDKFISNSQKYDSCFTVTDDWGEWLKVKERLAVKIKEVVESNGASFAFPSTSIYVEKQ